MNTADKFYMLDPFRIPIKSICRRKQTKKTSTRAH